MLKTNITEAFNYLNEHFTDYNGKVDEEYLNDSITLFMDNVHDLYKEMKYGRRPSHSIVWESLFALVNDELKHHGWKATGYHLKKWFAEKGLDYRKVLKPAVEYVLAEREKEEELITFE